MTMNVDKENANQGKEWSIDKVRSTKDTLKSGSRSLSLMSMTTETTPDKWWLSHNIKEESEFTHLDCLYTIKF